MNKNARSVVRLILLVILVAAVTLVSSNAFAGTVSRNGVSLTVPDSYLSCEPSNEITVAGIPEGGSVRFDFFIEDNGVLTSIGNVAFSSVSGGTVITGFPYPAMNPGTMTFIVGINVWNIPTPDLAVTSIAKLSGKWSVTCAPNTPTYTPEPTYTNTPEPTATATATFTPEPTATATPTTPPRGGQGCTPGYWRQAHHFDSWLGYAPANDFEIVFGVDASFDPHTLLDAVRLNGGGEFAMARHAVAALLNSSNPGVSFAYSTSQVVSMVQSAYATGDFETIKNLFERQNDTSCPLN